MQVYIEYAFAENFLLDFMLLFLAFKCTRESVRALPAVCASSFGAAFACVFALVSVPYAVSLCVKIAAGILMCFLARLHLLKGGFFKLSKSQKTAKIRAFLRYLCTFFALSACLAGVFFAIDYTGAALKAWQIPVCVFFVFACVAGAKKLFKTHKIARFVRQIEVCKNGETSGEKAFGLIDSGNRAKTSYGIPICFISPELALHLIDERTQFSDFYVSTVSGGKKIKIFFGSLLIYDNEAAHTINKRRFMRVYFAPSAHVSAKGGAEYAALLPADCLSDKAADGGAEVAEEAAVAAVNTAGNGEKKRNKNERGVRR